MKRREFIRNSSVLTLALPAILSQSCKPRLSSEPSASANGKAVDDFPLLEASIDDLQLKMERGEVTSSSLVEMYLDRIGKIDSNGVQLNSVIELNPDALSIATRLDQERKNGKVRSPLHGIPFMVKDNIDTGSLQRQRPNPNLTRMDFARGRRDSSSVPPCCSSHCLTSLIGNWPIH